jgi:hypothetical protein
LNLIFGKRCDPQTTLDDARHRLEFVFSARVNQSKKTLDDLGCRAISLKVDQRFSVGVCNLRWFLRVVGEVMDV